MLHKKAAFLQTFGSDHIQVSSDLQKNFPIRFCKDKPFHAFDPVKTCTPLGCAVALRCMQARSQVLRFRGQSIFLGGKIFVFIMLKRNFSGHNKTWGQLPPSVPPWLRVWLNASSYSND